MRSTNSGAVSIVLVIFVLLTLIFGGTSYWMFQEMEAYKIKWQDETAQVKAKDEELGQRKIDIDAKDRMVAVKEKEISTFKTRAESSERQMETQKNLAEEFKKDKKNLADRHREQLEEKDKFISELKNERDGLKGKIADLEAKLRDETDSFTKKIEETEERLAEINKKNRDVMAEKESRIRQLQERINQLINRAAKQFQNVQPDGEVLQANNDKRQVVINLGRRENLQPGLKFEVFQIRGGGKYVPKGIIEVKEVDDKLGYCYMLSINNISDPIIPGDLIGSPIYDKHEKKKFFVAGDFEKYQNADIKKLIEESGGIVAETINLYTDFVVLGVKNTGTARTDAIEVGVVMMNESQLLKYLMD